MTITVLLILAAFVALVFAMMGRGPVWLPVLFVVLVLLFEHFPLR